jgi:hypothetical protein
VEIVSWVVAASPEGTIVSWSKEHVTPFGRPEQARATGASNPFTGVTVSVNVAWPPELIVREDNELLRSKSGCKGMVYAADATALLLPLVTAAIASRVSVALTAIGPVYGVEEVVGVVPSVV